MAQFPETDRYSSNSHSTPTLYDSQKYWSTPTPSSSLENLSDLITWDSSHWGQDAASTELSPDIQVSIQASSVPPVPPQSESINATIAEKENHCPLCGIHFTQSQVLNRHMKDKHGDKESCAYCPNFKWCRGRPYTYRRHIQVNIRDSRLLRIHREGLARPRFHVLADASSSHFQRSRPYSIPSLSCH